MVCRANSSINRQHDTQGSVIVIMMVIAAVIGLTLIGILSWAQQAHRDTVRSKAWNAALPLAEAGVEEALAHLAFTNNIESSGWIMENGRATKSRSLGTDYFKAFIETNLTQAKVDALDIVSRGFVKMPLTETQFVSRAIKVSVTNAPLFMAALTLKNVLNMKKHDMLVDSYNSQDPAYSTNGRYDPAKQRDGGHVFSVLGIKNPNPKKAKTRIYGQLKTGLGGILQLGDGGAAGSKRWHNKKMKGIERGWATNDLRYAFPEIQPPSGALPPSNGSVDGTAYDLVLPTGKWITDRVKGSVYVNGHASLTVTGNINLDSGNDSIVIGPNASLKIFLMGKKATFVGSTNNNVIINKSGNPMSFQFYGNNSQMTIKGMTNVSGLVYAPNAALHLGEDKQDTMEWQGSLVIRKLDLEGRLQLHYDEAVQSIPSPIYKLASWKEIL